MPGMIMSGGGNDCCGGCCDYNTGDLKVQGATRQRTPAIVTGVRAFTFTFAFVRSQQVDTNMAYIK
jgi:hypothetical protein